MRLSKIISGLLFSAVLSIACGDNAGVSTSATDGAAPEKPLTGVDAGAADAAMAGVDAAMADAAASSAAMGGVPVDVVVLTATQEMGGEQAVYRKELARLLDGLRGVTGVDLRMALVAPRDAMDATFRASLDGAGDKRFVPFDFDADPKKGLVVAAALGCPEKESEFIAINAASTRGPIVCGKDLAVLLGVKAPSLEHDWLWELAPIPGKLMSFFRPNARRVYVFVSSGAAGYLSAKQWTDLVALQPQKGSAVVVAVSPQAAANKGLCVMSPADKVYGDLAKASMGATEDFCATNWTAATAAAVDVLKKVAR